jgi:hypothetical protein
MIDLLLKLEMSLWLQETRFNKKYMDGILHPDFMEFGKSGNTYYKTDILNNMNGTIKAKLPFKNLKVKQIGDAAFLLTYQAELIENDHHILTNRSSIWISGKTFQLLFHQGTTVDIESDTWLKQ